MVIKYFEEKGTQPSPSHALSGKRRPETIKNMVAARGSQRDDTLAEKETEKKEKDESRRSLKPRAHPSTI